MNEELRPCPFCGAMPEKLRTGYMCSTLGCALQENTVSEKEWNTRPIEDALNKRIAELEAVVDKLIWSVEGRVEFMYSKHQREFEDIVAEYKEREG